ncbi:ECF transporter S component [Clostridium weizhouense]|uniref:ECF transporter S component n=1 Tax=Clostridium weizhouense TaxID=2859781 RepID=A0ABS7APJ8_9CLOT|nr:ECF transporter S component [Clostridium weizhouense]MBW6410586.1 ECF transporter S component [Clostridium weizhouense]
MRFSTRRMVLIGVMAAICFVGTYLHVPLAVGGSTTMIHLGTTAIFIAAVLIGPDAGLSAGIGCALYDALDPTFAAWIIPTLIVKGLTGYVAGKISFMNNKNGENSIQNIIGFIAGGIVSLIGYFIFNWLVFVGLASATIKLLASIGTTALGLAIAIPLSIAIKKATTHIIGAIN